MTEKVNQFLKTFIEHRINFIVQTYMFVEITQMIIGSSLVYKNNLAEISSKIRKGSSFSQLLCTLTHCS